MDVDEIEAMTIPFQLQFDKPIASQITIAEWNPEKDLLAMVTEDSKILLHRFNWQRLWTVSPGRCITSLCWRPDGKAIAVGLEDGTISLHDVENGKLLRSIKSHSVAVVCLSWEEDGQPPEDDSENILNYEDRTSRFFPAAPRVPRMPGLSATDAEFTDDAEDSFTELSNSSHQHLNILCSGDKDGSICFSIFGIFPIGKINVHKFPVQSPLVETKTVYQLLKASICKISLSKDLRQLIVLSYGEHMDDLTNMKDSFKDKQASSISMHSLLLNTSIFRNRKNELHQMAQQSSNIEDLIEVVRVSLSLMHKQWADAMCTFHEKFDPLSSLIIDHGLDSTPQEEFLSLLTGARTSPPIHQFLVNSLGEAGLKRVSKAIDSAAKELHLVARDHLQPAAEIIAFRSGELKGLSRWRARYRSIGLDEKLVNNAMEKAGMLLVQVERFLRVLSGVAYQFQNFFTWVSKCIKLLMSEPSDQLQPFNCELIVMFLKFLYDQDPVRQLLENSDGNHNIIIDQDTMQRVEELVKFGGFSDTEYLHRTLTKEFEEMEDSFKLAFLMPFTTISKKIYCEDIWPLFPVSSSPTLSSYVPTSVSFYQDVVVDPITHTSQRILDYICFQIPDISVFDLPSTVGIVRHFAHDYSCKNNGNSSPEAALLRIPDGFQCVDLSLYKDSQVVLLLNETTATSESPEKAWLMIVETSTLPFMTVPRMAETSLWWFHCLMNSAVELNMEKEKVRSIPHSVMAPFAVSASRGLACIFAVRKRALVYILEEDEDEVSEME
ncbi:hypothetical protein H6P81_000459 [Aristolochia fimbriata]|uniref:Anaphase-promoting complex subunit 4 n=1 Tax=Aristolochia fimbriata TaxID=158543 RepID=A0AAV7F776_ARIFI|nr:hypothetical protein H6P81_000459 [Aristolochia fimbriata]